MLSRGLLRESYHQNQKMLLPARRRINDADFITDRDGERNAKNKNHDDGGKWNFVGFMLNMYFVYEGKKA